MGQNEKFHVFSLCYNYIAPSGQTTTGNGYAMQKTKIVTENDIQECKKILGMNENSVMISCSYLGYMTKDEFMNGVD